MCDERFSATAISELGGAAKCDGLVISILKLVVVVLVLVVSVVVFIPTFISKLLLIGGGAGGTSISISKLVLMLAMLLFIQGSKEITYHCHTGPKVYLKH